MEELPKGGLIGRTIWEYRKIAALQIPLYAANACYFITLAFFPALLLLFGLLRYTPLEVEQLARNLEGILPAAFLEGAEELILTSYDASPKAMLGLSALAALWAASRGLYGVLTGLNAIYQVRESRGYVYIRLISAAHTAVFLLVLVLTLTLHVFAFELLELMRRVSHPFLGFLLEIIDFRFFLLLFSQTFVFALMYTALPNRHNAFRSSIPGALLASCGWLIFSNLFSVYVERFSRQADLYGSVSALALGMLWLYFCMCIFFYGGVLNVKLQPTG